MIKTRWLEKKIMCGHCKFTCCTNPSFNVEITTVEQKLYKEKYNKDLPLKWKLGKDPKCPNLTDTGCDLGDDKPAHCKSYPLELDKNNKIKVGTWCWLHCPKPQDYEFIEKKNNMYHYKLIEKPKYKQYNKLKTIELPEPIDDYFKPVGSDHYDYYENLKILYEQTAKYKEQKQNTLEKFQ